VQAILKGRRELRLPADCPHPVEEGKGEVAPVRTAAHREPACWVLIHDWCFDDDTDEYVIELQRCAAPDTPRFLMPKPRKVRNARTVFRGPPLLGASLR
jgi:hypothetical protein